MALDYSVEPSLLQRWKPALQNWRLFAFIGFFFVLFGCFGYTILSEVLTHGIHQHGNYTSAELKPMGQFPLNEQNGLLTDVPKEYRELDGKRVELKGMMWDLHAAGPQIAQFQLVYNIQKCCFNGPPLVQERVFVHAPEAKKVRFYDQLVSCVGTLHVRLKRDDQGTIRSVYDMDLDTVTPAID